MLALAMILVGLTAVAVFTRRAWDKPLLKRQDLGGFSDETRAWKRWTDTIGGQS
jgi:hypothetical protein